MNPVPKVTHKKKKKAKKHKGVQSLKKDLDFIFSWYIRLKDSVNGKVACYTCGKIFDVIEIQAGHYWERNTSPLRFDESNVKPQCGICNCSVFGSKGKPQEFAAHLVKEYGGDHLEKLDMLKKVSMQWKTNKLQELIDNYTLSVKQILTFNGEIKISKKLEKWISEEKSEQAKLKSNLDSQGLQGNKER